MQWQRIKFAGKKVWGGAKWFLGWPFAIFGITGFTDSIETWSRWIDRTISWAHNAMSDPYVQQLAARAAGIADFLNQAPIRIGLFIVGLSILGWGWRPFWALRHKLIGLWRSALGEDTWVTLETAIQLVESSDWARIREPMPSFIDQIGFSSGYTREMVRFKHFIKMTLESFETVNPSHVREIENKKQYREDRLLRFLSQALDEEAIAKFGEVPKGTV